MFVSTQEKRAAVCHEKSTVEWYRSALQMRESPDGWGVGDLEEKLRFLVRCSGWGLGVCVVGMCVSLHSRLRIFPFYVRKCLSNFQSLFVC